MTIRDEAKFEESVRSFAYILNKRFAKVCLEVGREWVRIRPPTMDEARDFSIDYRCIKFVRVGTLVTITEVASDYIEISCAGDRMLYFVQEFKETWIPTVSQDSWRKSNEYYENDSYNKIN